MRRRSTAVSASPSKAEPVPAPRRSSKAFTVHHRGDPRLDVLAQPIRLSLRQVAVLDGLVQAFLCGGDHRVDQPARGLAARGVGDLRESLAVLQILEEPRRAETEV